MVSDFTPNFDAAAPYPQVVAARTAVRSGDWAAFRARYDAAANWSERWTIMGVVEDLDGCEDLLRRVMQRDPEDLVAATMYGIRLVDIGWSIRTRRRARHVTRAQFKGFFAYLKQAEEVLTWVCAADAGFVPAWIARIRVARGLQLSKSQSRRRYGQVIQLDPHNLPAQISLLQNFARSGAAGSPRCTPSLLIARPRRRPAPTTPRSSWTGTWSTGPT
jgi:hypothetical protein